MKKTVKLIAALMAVIFICALFAGCKEKDPDAEKNPVVLKLGDMTLTRFYWDSLYGTNKNYYHLSQGAISMEDYFKIVQEEMERYAVTLKAARDKNFELTAEEEASIEADAESQWEYIKGVFMDKVDESITDSDAVLNEFERLFELDTGYSSELYRKCLRETLRDRLLIKKLMASMTEGMEPDDAEIRNQIDLLINSESQSGFSSFVSRFKSYAAGEGDPFVFVPDECFTVVQYLVNDGDGADQRMAEADAALEAGMTSAEFTELVGSDSNDDESMREERARSMGYLVHDDLRDEYTTEFFYAANVANGRKVVPGMQMGSIPEYDVYKTTDNRIVVKIHEEGCTRYLMVARKYIKGNVSYKAGDDIWELGRRTATEYIQRKYFDDQVEEWYQAALKGKKIKWYFDRFKSSYLPRILED